MRWALRPNVFPELSRDLKASAGDSLSIHAFRTNNTSLPQVTEGHPETISTIINQFLAALPKGLNLSGDIEQLEEHYRAYGGQFDLFYGYSLRYQRYIAIRRSRGPLGVDQYADKVSS